ncbi:MAG: Aspartate racemase [Alphaproteobacteria bacterium ADurb.Bin438]|nr:MAG: Aspartate racemase [Alphaproteobacteria bacterium ADurb.Bin438]
MKTIGLIGGMSFESTITYYQVINEVINQKFGGLSSAKCILYSVNFQEIEKCQKIGDWAKSAKILSEAGLALQKAGADFILICTNTMHKVFDEVQESINIPLIHIADVTFNELEKNKIKKVILLGTKYTMEQDFYKQRIIKKGIDVIVPDEVERQEINRIIFEELCKGVIKKDSKEFFLKVIKRLEEKGAEGVIFGCTEIGLLINKNDVKTLVFDTALIHAKEAALMLIENN